jgi:hypothetical protein
MARIRYEIIHSTQRIPPRRADNQLLLTWNQTYLLEVSFASNFAA